MDQGPLSDTKRGDPLLETPAGGSEGGPPGGSQNGPFLGSIWGPPGRGGFLAPPAPRAGGPN